MLERLGASKIKNKNLLKQVLIADDDPFNLYVLDKILRRMGILVTKSSNGLEVL
jgi:CheY-like chemotaxis protein